jgi:surface antigen
MNMTVSMKTARVIALSLVATWTATVLAQPPAHAPAHGWRAQHDPHYLGFSGKVWSNDYEIASGRCNRQAIATAVGGVVGGVVASRVADENRTVATLIGIAAGALIGNRIGRWLDDRDRNCIGHALEIGQAGRTVVWTNESTGVRYELEPGRERNRDGASCRQFRMTAVADGRRSSQRGLACQSQPGVWEIVG